MTTLSEISRERVAEELIKGFTQAQHPELYFLGLADMRILYNIILPFDGALKTVHDSRGHHHNENLIIHTADVIRNIRKYDAQKTADSYPFFYIIAMLHDIGKIYTRRITEEKISFLGHDRIGASIAWMVLRNLKFSNSDISCAERIIRNHMRLNLICNSPHPEQSKSLAKLFMDLDENPFLGEVLISLAEADQDRELSIIRKKFSEWRNLPPVISGLDVLDIIPTLPKAQRTKFETNMSLIGKLIKVMRLYQLHGRKNFITREAAKKRLIGEAKQLANGVA